MSAIGSKIEYDLGAWGYKDGKERKQVSLKLFEESKYSYYLIDPLTGKVGETTEYVLAGDDPLTQSVLKTKELPFLPRVLFLPPRSDYLDFFIPLTRRISSTFEGSRVVKNIKLVLSVAADILTLVFRIFTFLPMLGLNKYKEHPLKSKVGGAAEAIFVKCEKTWEIEGTSDLQTRCTSIYYWHAFLGDSPLRQTFVWNGKSYPIEEEYWFKQPDGNHKKDDRLRPNIIEDKNNKDKENAFVFGKEDYKLTPQILFQKVQMNGTEHKRQLRHCLEDIVFTDPDVVYL